jgi:UDP-galactopyranose mutase
VSAAGVDFLVVGAGFAGCVCARELADRGYRVRRIERRNHVGGNAHDYRDTHGLLVHAYGRYYNMDQVVGAALKAVRTLLNERGGRVMPALS